jgi:Vacuolar 14 Fab1-binding region
MYNIAKVAKGEILLFFNDIFDALAKVGVLHILGDVATQSDVLGSWHLIRNPR